jgi:hypothetical protein
LDPIHPKLYPLGRLEKGEGNMTVCPQPISAESAFNRMKYNNKAKGI